MTDIVKRGAAAIGRALVEHEMDDHALYVMDEPDSPEASILARAVLEACAPHLLVQEAPKMSLTSRMQNWLEVNRTWLPEAAVDDMEDMLVEVATMELGKDGAMAHFAKSCVVEGQNVLPFVPPNS